MEESIKIRGFHSMRIRISVLIILAALILTAAISFVALSLFTRHTRERHLDIAKGVAVIAQKIIDADSVERYKAEGRTASGYEETLSRLNNLQKNVPDIEYLYVYQIREDGCHVIFDTGEESGDYAVDALVEFDPTFLPYVPDLLEGKQIPALESNDSYGWLLTHYHPIFDSNGKCVCYVGVDISMVLLRTYRLKFLFRTIILSLVAVILVVGLGLWISTKFLVNPINGISRHAIDFMGKNGNVDGMNACVSTIKKLDIRTGDEVENLYASFLKMTENTVQNIIDINKMQEERIQIMQKYNEELEKKVEERTYELKLEKEKSENLLLNILPKEVSVELTEHSGKTIAQDFPNVTVLFTDIVGFTKISGDMTADEVVNMLNKMVSLFDERARREGIEKIKTIGDAYMAAAGLTKDYDNGGAVKMIDFARGLLDDINSFNKDSAVKIQIRLGINTGNLVAGVIGKTKFIYDIWGDTVNVASRMESTGEPMKIHVSEETYEQTKEKFAYGNSIDIEVKGKGKMKTYFL